MEYPSPLRQWAMPLDLLWISAAPLRTTQRWPRNCICAKVHNLISMFSSTPRRLGRSGFRAGNRMRRDAVPEGRRPADDLYQHCPGTLFRIWRPTPPCRYASPCAIGPNTAMIARYPCRRMFFACGPRLIAGPRSKHTRSKLYRITTLSIGNRILSAIFSPGWSSLKRRADWKSMSI